MEDSSDIVNSNVPVQTATQGPVVGDQIRSLYSAHQAEIARRKSAVENECMDTDTKMYTGFSHLKFSNSDETTSKQFTDADQQYFAFNISHTGLPPLVDGNDPGIRICGIFSTLEEAQEHAHFLSSNDPDCCVLVAPMQQWVVLGSTPELLSDDTWCKEQKQRLLQKHDKEIADRDAEFANRRCQEDNNESETTMLPPDRSQVSSQSDSTSQSTQVEAADESNKRYYSQRFSRNLEIRNQNTAVVSFVRDEEGSNPAHLMFNVWMSFDNESEANSWVRNVAGDQIIHHSLDTVDMYQWLFPQSATDEKIRNCTYRNSEEQTIMSFASQQTSTVEGFKRFCEADGREAPTIEI